jgi:ribosomal protein L21E
VLRNLKQILGLLQHKMQQAQDRMKKYADLKRTKRKFEIGQKVYLRLQPYRQSLVAYRRALKLAPLFYGPFSVLCKVMKVAYELDLPFEACIHRVFHVSHLKPKLGSASTAIPKLPPVDGNDVLQPKPAEVLDCQARPKNHRPLIELLIRWEGHSADDATWEKFYSLQDAYPHLMGKVF